MAYLDTSAIQRGLSDLGDALSQERRAYNTQQINTAKLLATQKMNDKIAEMTTRKEFSGDWGLEGRQSALDIASEVGANIEDPQARAAFETEIQQNIESSVPQFRAIQSQKMTESVSATEALNDQHDLAIAPKDWTQFTTHVLTRYGEDGQTDNMVMASGSPQNAQKRRMSLIDQGAGSFVQAKVDQIMNDQNRTWAQKKEQLSVLKDSYKNAFATGISPSQPTMDKLDAAISGELATATKQAILEHKNQGMAQLAGIASSISGIYAGAKVTGQGFNPTQAFAPMLKDPTLDTDVREAVNAAIKNYTLEADKGLTDAQKGAAVKTNKEQFTALLEVMLQKGASNDSLTAKVNEWAQDGKIDPLNYNDLMGYAKQNEAFKNDTTIKGVLNAFSDLPEEAKARLAVAFKEQIGGFYNDGSMDAYKKDGRWDTGKLETLAKGMKEAEKSRAFDQIINSRVPNNLVEGDELTTFVQRANDGKLIGQLGPADIKTKAQPYVDALWRKLQTEFPKIMRPDVLNPTVPVSFNLYTQAGLPTFHLANGDEYTPTTDGITIKWNVKTSTKSSAPDPNKKGY